MRPGAAALARIAVLARPAAGRLALAVLAGAAASGAAVGLTATSAWLISAASEQPPVLSLMVAITGVRFFGVSRGFFRYAERLASHDAAFRVLGTLRVRAYERLERLTPAGSRQFQSGDLLSRIVDDVDGLADLWLRVLIPYLVAALAAAATVALVWYLVPAAGMVLATTLLVVALAVPAATVAVARHSERRISGTRGRLAAATLELLAGAPELVVAGALESRLAGLSGLAAELARADSRSAAGTGLGAFLSGISAGAAVWLGLVAGISALRSGSLGWVALAVVVLVPIAIHEAVAPLVAGAQHLPGLAAMAGRITDILRRPDPVAEPSPCELAPTGPLGLRCRGLRARYPGSDRDALAMPDFDLEPGHRLLVTGPSGSGKSTFADVLVRFLEPSGGSVELAGSDRSVDIRNLAGDDTRKLVCLCEQDPHVFDTSLGENLRLARPSASDDELRGALEAAQLTAWVSTLPRGLDTPVGEHGAAISGGQRQRLSLARALLAQAPVIVFDEPTEHLDEATATALTADLLAATEGRTMVMITHRPELMAAAEWDLRVELAGSPPEGEP